MAACGPSSTHRCTAPLLGRAAARASRVVGGRRGEVARASAGSRRVHAAAADVDDDATTVGVGSIAPFKLERWFAQYEFTAPYLLCCSDCTALSMRQLLAMADDDSLQLWDELSLGYTEAPGLPALRQEIAGTYETTSADDVIVTVPEEGIYLTMIALLKPGDHVVVTYPGYQSLFEVARSIGCEVDLWQPEATSTGLQFNPAALQALVTKNTSLVAVNFPHNPTGFVPTHEQWAAVVATAADVGAHLFCDEMYRGLELQEGGTLQSGVDVYDKAVVLCGMSKIYSLPGTRIGWLATHDSELLRRVGELKDYTTICSSAPSEVLALMGLRGREAIVEKNLRTMRSNLTLLDDFFDQHADEFTYYPPQGATVVFPELTVGRSDEWCAALVRDTGILLLPGTAYDYEPADGRQHFRIGFGREDMGDVLQRLRAHLTS